MSTLAHHAKRPFVRAFDMSAVSVPIVADRYNQGVMFADDSVASKATVEYEALWFYLTNHAMSLLRKEYGEHRPLLEAEWLVNDYHENNQVRALRLFYYLWLICTREARHLKSTYTGKHVVAFKFLKTFQHEGPDDAITALTKNPPDMSMGDYVQFLYEVFRIPGWSSAFGGLKWATVVKVLLDFVRGTLSAEMMLDTAFTLCHNGGPIFNKGYLYNMYSDQLTTILDAQAEGKIPEMVSGLTCDYATDDMQAYMERVKDLGIDWGVSVPEEEPNEFEAEAGDFGDCIPDDCIPDDCILDPDVPESKKFWLGPTEWVEKTERGE